MRKPKIFDGEKWLEFDSTKEHDLFIESIRSADSPDYKQIVINRIEKGKNVLIEYLSDNAKINLTMQQSIEQLTKFQVVKSFLEVGNIEDSIQLISLTETDEIFTEERKQKYLTMLQ